ncbi:MAG: glycosyltransferase [Pseudomonadota bacterium]
MTSSHARKPRLLFLSPQFLFPMDAGGKIRTANILKNMKGGAFHIDLVMPADEAQQLDWAPYIDQLADEVYFFAPPPEGLSRQISRLATLFTALPVAVRSEARAAARDAFDAGLRRKPDFILFDYVHALAMATGVWTAPSAFFAHNVETEIFRRHADLTSGAMGAIWQREARAMEWFETAACRKVDGVITVSDRDAEMFRKDFGIDRALSIPTGVDLEFFSWQAPGEAAAPEIVFTGSLDWRANQDGLLWFLKDVWPLITKEVPDATFRIIGKNPPDHLISAAKDVPWEFTGFVDDVRDHARGTVYVIPLRAGGGTRIKAFEAMAMGVPVVSTGLGVEGLDVVAGRHYLHADAPGDFADEVVRLLGSADLRSTLSRQARALCEEHFSHAKAAAVFERHCLTLMRAT